MLNTSHIVTSSALSLKTSAQRRMPSQGISEWPSTKHAVSDRRSCYMLRPHEGHIAAFVIPPQPPHFFIGFDLPPDFEATARLILATSEDEIFPARSDITASLTATFRRPGVLSGKAFFSGNAKSRRGAFADVFAMSLSHQWYNTCMSNASFEFVKNWTELTCRTCSKKFWLQPSRVKHGKGVYCSTGCWVSDQPSRRIGKGGVSRYKSDNFNWKGLSIKKPCPVCGTPFNPYAQSTCSRQCGQVARVKKISGANNPFARAHPAKIKTCLLCNKQYRNTKNVPGSGQYYCSSACYIRSGPKSPRAMWINRKLTDLGYSVSIEKSWPWLHRPGIGQRMRVDLYIDSLKIAIEYDGEHHFKVCHGGTSEKLSRIQECDKVKDALLIQNGIKVIRVNGWPIDINDIVSQF